MTIGTAKPDADELAAAPHYFVNSHHIDEPFNANDFEKEALKTIKKLHLKDDNVIMVGGSGLYVKAVCEGFDPIPAIDPSIRTVLNSTYEQSGLNVLLDELKAKDFPYFEMVDQQNPQRVIRALEVIRGTGNAFSSYRVNSVQKRPFEIVKIGLEMERAQLYERINLRMDLMLKQGLIDEAKSLYPRKGLNALQTVGYQEIFEFIDEKYDLDECIRLLKRNSRRYSKRQMTWFKRDLAFEWINLSEKSQEEALKEILRFVNT